MSNVSDKSFIYRSYPKLAYGSIYLSMQRDMAVLLYFLKVSFLTEGYYFTLFSPNSGFWPNNDFLVRNYDWCKNQFVIFSNLSNHKAKDYTIMAFQNFRSTPTY